MSKKKEEEEDPVRNNNCVHFLYYKDMALRIYGSIYNFFRISSTY